MRRRLKKIIENNTSEFRGLKSRKSGGKRLCGNMRKMRRNAGRIFSPTFNSHYLEHHRGARPLGWANWKATPPTEHPRSRAEFVGTPSLGGGKRWGEKEIGGWECNVISSIEKYDVN